LALKVLAIANEGIDPQEDQRKAIKAAIVFLEAMLDECGP
jgi:hypothetical protein